MIQEGYLVIRNNIIVFIGESISELLKALDIVVTDKGLIEVSSKNYIYPTSYNMQMYSKEEVMIDIVRYYLEDIAAILEVGVYKIERI